MIELPVQTIFYQIEKSIKEYRRFAQYTINQKVKDLTLDQTLLLISLNDSPQLSLTEQSEILFKENSSITRMIDSLVAKGYLLRTINVDDKRKFDLQVTSRGKKTIEELMKIIESNRQKALVGIAKSDLDQMGTTLKKIISNCQIVVFFAVFVVGIKASYAQDLLLESEKEELIGSVSQIILDNYVFPEVAIEIKQFISKRRSEGAYKEINNPVLLSELLTKDIQSISHDKHLRVLYEPERIKKQQTIISVEDSLENAIEKENRLRNINYGFTEAKILDGNIGYLDLRRFSNPEIAGTTADASIRFLKNTDAIIIDLRKNGGGTPQMVQWIISYFFDGEPFLLNSFYKRNSDYTKQFWTIPHSSTIKLPDTKLYILTSKTTFSAAEEFAYDLKQLKRATIIGETTAGGAHPGGRIIASSKFNVWTPTARAINPITHSNWEGTGVTPDVKVPAEKALDVAYIKSLEELKERNNSFDYEKIIQRVQNK